NNHSGQLLSDVSIVDRLPAGFSYIKGSALVDGVPSEPAVTGRTLSWDGLVIAGNQERTVKVLLAVAGGTGEGGYANQRQGVRALPRNACRRPTTGRCRAATG